MLTNKRRLNEIIIGLQNDINSDHVFGQMIYYKESIKKWIVVEIISYPTEFVNLEIEVDQWSIEHFIQDFFKNGYIGDFYMYLNKLFPQENYYGFKILSKNDLVFDDIDFEKSEPSEK